MGGRNRCSNRGPDISGQPVYHLYVLPWSAFRDETWRAALDLILSLGVGGRGFGGSVCRALGTSCVRGFSRVTDHFVGMPCFGVVAALRLPLKTVPRDLRCCDGRSASGVQ